MSEEKSKFALTVGDLKKFIETKKLPDDMHIEVFDFESREYTFKTRAYIYHYDDGDVTLRIFRGDYLYNHP